MSTKKRLIAVCVSLLTIPAFAMENVPYNVEDSTDQAYAISYIERTFPINLVEMKETRNAFEVEKIAEATTECGTETTEHETETTTTTVTTTMTITTVVTQTPTEAMVTETVMEVEVENQVDNADAVEPSSEADSSDEETMVETFHDEETTEEVMAEEFSTEEETCSAVTGRYEFVWEGTKLTKRSGIVPANQTPSGLKETYYNLRMYGCLDLLGYSYDGYSEDDPDGFKTYNGYIMVASPDLNRWPKGSLIETTNGMGIVVDFCPAGNLDIAVTW